MVAAGFNPRMKIAVMVWRRVATPERLERIPAFNRRCATDGAAGLVNRGLKPTATLKSSLRDGVLSPGPVCEDEGNIQDSKSEIT